MRSRIVAELLIPGRGSPIEHGAVVFDDGVIDYAGPAASAPTRHDGETVHEVPVVMPGLWDSHAHFLGLHVVDLERLSLTDPTVTAARATADAARTLMGGVTSVRDVGGPGLQLSKAIDEGSIAGPTIYGAGRILSTTGGHADVHSLPLDFVHRIDETSGLGYICDGVPEALRAVRRNLRANAKLIKVCASGGVGSEVDHPIHQQFSHDELCAIVDEAARAERWVAAHCHGKPGIMAALEAGVKTIEHGSYLDEEVADIMVRNDAILVPTRFVNDRLLARADELPGYVYRKLLLVADQHAEALKIAIAKGVRIAAGCDIFVTGDDYGRNSLEVRHLINAGMAELDAIDAATASGPETLGPQAPQSGQLRPSFDADIIALARNPLDHHDVWGEPDEVTHVWKAGVLVKGPQREGMGE